MAELPELELTHGQLLWSIRYGHEPMQAVKDQIRYLRALGIPAAAKEQARGPGSRIRYDFFDLVEIGYAVTALDLHFRPQDIAAVLADKRNEMRGLYSTLWLEIPEAALTAGWVKSQGREVPLVADEAYLRVHDRRSEQWGQIDFVGPNEASETLPFFEPVERLAGSRPLRLIPMKRLMIQWVVWAQEAPATKPGPVGRGT